MCVSMVSNWMLLLLWTGCLFPSGRCYFGDYLTCIFKLCQYNINVALLNIEINCKMLLNLFLLSCVLWVFYQVINRSYRSEFILTCPDYPDTTDLCTLFVSLGACISVQHITPKGLIRILTYLRNKITSVMAS